MKKYTNKILIICAVLYLAAVTTLFCIKAYEIKKNLKHSTGKELIINY